MSEPTVICPHCGSEIKLTESLAAPLLASIRREYEQRLTQKDADMAKREQLVQQREAMLQKTKDTLDERVAQKVQQERANARSKSIVSCKPRWACTATSKASPERRCKK
jgi:hypothetical protein